jgi:hypothetical protein
MVCLVYAIIDTYLECHTLEKQSMQRLAIAAISIVDQIFSFRTLSYQELRNYCEDAYTQLEIFETIQKVFVHYPDIYSIVRYIYTPHQTLTVPDWTLVAGAVALFGCPFDTAVAEILDQDVDALRLTFDTHVPVEKNNPLKKCCMLVLTDCFQRFDVINIGGSEQ